MIAALQAMSSLVALAWITAAATLTLTTLFGTDAPELARAIFHELRPFYLVAVVASFVLEQEHNGWSWFTLVMSLVNWLFFKDIDDDDRWKRRRQRLADQVAVLDGRLTVVPAGAR